jgi:hypothetical protein
MDRGSYMKYVVEKIEEDIVVLESLENKEKKEVHLFELPENTKEGNVLIYENENYTKAELLEEQRREIIKNKFDMLRKKVDNS